MNFKKFIAILVVSICIFNAVHGMETLQEFASNKVVQAGMVMGLGAATSAGAYYLNQKIVKKAVESPSIGAGVLHGAVWSLPASLYVLCQSSSPEFSLKKWSLLAGALTLSHTVPVLCNLRDKAVHDDNEFIMRHLPWFVMGKSDSITGEDQKLQKVTKRNVLLGPGVSYLAMGILKLYDLLPF